MLIVDARIPNLNALDKTRRITKGEVWHLKADGEAFTAELIVHEDELPRLEQLGVSFEVRFDSRKAPDPKEQVSRGNRFAEQVERLKGKQGGRG